jgi:predicted glycosyltransferase
MKSTLMLYCQHSVGVGHLIRSIALAEALAEHWHVLLLNGGRIPSGISLPEGVDTIHLPPLGAAADGTLISHDESHSVDEAKLRRRQQILNCFETVDPQVILIELFPFGRKKFSDEILPLLERAQQRGRDRPLVLCSVRDVLVSRKDQELHDNRAAELLNRYFHGVLVHSDPNFVRLEETFNPRQPLEVPVHYTGFVGRKRSRRPAPARERRVLVSSGGGQTGSALFRAALQAQPILWQGQGLPMTLIAGPFLSEAEWRGLRVAGHNLPGLTLLRTVPDVGAAMEQVGASVSRCGYNTSLDILFSGVPAVVAPFGEGHEDEQLKRARRLERLGLLQVLDPARLDGQTLAHAIRALETFRPDSARLQLGGAANTTEWINQHFAHYRARRSPRERLA